MCELVKEFNHEHLAKLVASSREPSLRLYVKHIHDEALMRIRSLATTEDTRAIHTAIQKASKLALCRSRSSKHNHTPHKTKFTA